MWPWEHLALGYLLYSLYTHGRLGTPPEEDATLALAVGTQFPDLVDKPLGWGAGLLREGVFAHSLFVAVPLSLVVVAVAARRGRAAAGWAFGFGYLSHLPGDALYGVVYGQQPNFGFMLWPLVGQRTTARTGFLENLTYYLARSQTVVFSADGFLYLGLEAVLLLAAVSVWVLDGRPGGSLLRQPRGPH